MEKLTINTFIDAIDDLEMSEYLVLGKIKNYLEQLRHNKIYPVLTELLEIDNLLEDLMRKKARFQNLFPKRVQNLDPENRTVIYSTVEFTDSEIEKVFEFIMWAMPRIKETLREAKEIHDFVKRNIHIAEIGIIPLYRNEGYFIVPDNQQKREQIFRFEMSLIPAESVLFNIIKTHFIESLSKAEIASRVLRDLKLELIRKYPELPNPAAYICETDLDFPFDETIFPVAKDKLATKLAA